MEFTSYTVKDGDTLAKIAYDHKTDVTSLRRLNPFIRNADHIQAGWSLSVPQSEEPSDPSSEHALPVSAAQTCEVAEALPVLTLAPESLPNCSSDECFAPEQAPACSKRYANIIYATHEQEFWLLPERAASAIKEAEHLLNQQISPSKAADDRKRGLDESGLLEYFLEPDPVNFLEGEQREEILQLQREAPALANNRISKRGFILGHVSNREVISPEEYQRLENIYDRRKMLHDAAVSKAQAQGYAYENGMLFSPEAVAARKAIERYNAARDKLLETGVNLPDSYQEDFAKFVADSARRFTDAVDCRINCGAQFKDYYRWRKETKRAFADQRAYLDSIIDAAQYGIALPEFALVSGSADAADRTDVSEGVRKFKEYLRLEKLQRHLLATMQEKYSRWLKATGENASAPTSLVTAEKNIWDGIQKEKEALRLQAEQNVAEMHPRRHLLWHPEEFKPRPVERLVKTNFPLREVSFADGKGPLSHFSLKDMNMALPESASKVFTASNVELKLPGNSVAASASTDFRNWLVEQGAFVIKDQAGDWFDSQGWFDVDGFHEYLDSNGLWVATLEDPSARHAWGERLRQMLFKDSVRNMLRLIDTSPQAQLVRCLTPPQESIHKGVSIDAPTLNVADGLSTGVTASLDIDLARGEVELFNIDLPERAKAREVALEYDDYNGNRRSMAVGRFSTNIRARAWGYAGASLMLAGSLRLSPDKASHDVTLGSEQPAQREPGIYSRTAVSQTRLPGRAADARLDDGLRAQFNLFAGVQAGIKIDGALNWAPPKELAMLRAAPISNNASEKTAEAEAATHEWLALARLSVSLTAAAGVGFSGDISISLSQGRFVLRLKAALIAGPGADGSFAFEVGYEGVEQLINLFRRELHRNQGKPLKWVEPDAASYMSKFNVFGSVGFDVRMLYLMGINTVMNLYENLTSVGKGGHIAYIIMTDKKPVELKRWIIEAPPEALGPLLMTLISGPSSFYVSEPSPRASKNSKQGVVEKSAAESRIYQQQAIELILAWLVENAFAQGSLADAQKQFEEACTRMTRFGTKPCDAGSVYCENRLRMDNFMEVQVVLEGSSGGAESRMRERYRSHVATLGEMSDKFCRRSSYYGRTFIPGGHARHIGEKR
ncbi:LysM peptidoglycan-binding domain-containing protein [Pseudomonas sp. Marseille-QA0892]